MCILVGASVLTPANKSDAGLAACLLTARDAKITFPGVNYVAFASATCLGENFQGAQLDLVLQYYDWGEARWIADSFFGKQVGQNDDFIVAYNFAYADPSIWGINCRRIKATYRFTHSGRHQLFYLNSSGQCY